MKILTIDKHVERHDHIRQLLSKMFNQTEISTIANLKGYTQPLDENDLILVHVGNTVDYNIIFRKNLSCIIIYYTGQYDIVEVEANVIYSSYKQLKHAIYEASALL